jgi:hypothetical protein
VTCTGGSGAQKEQQQQSQEYFDPGEVPKNIYDRGFVENWKEVIFPISLRKNALEMCVYSRPSKAAGQPPKAKATKPTVASNKTKSG